MRESASVCASSLPPSLHRVHRAYARANSQPHLLGRVLRGCERESTRERERNDGGIGEKEKENWRRP